MEYERAEMETGKQKTIALMVMQATQNLAHRISESFFMSFTLPAVHRSMVAIGVPEEALPSAKACAYTMILLLITCLMYNFHFKRRKQLKHQLREAQEKLRYLQEKLDTNRDKQEVRIFMDGAFDLLHYGHMNAFRLGRSLGTHLIVGVNSDESITQCKGAPLMNDEERMTMVSSCKFVDEVVPDCPYIMNREYLQYVIEKYNIDYVVHGDDPCIVDGKDVYAEAKAAGKYRGIPRTEGVSTTDIVGRMLLMTREHHHYDEDADSSSAAKSSSEWVGRQSRFLTTSRMLQLFSADIQAPRKDMHVVYIDGSWDLFHPGHVALIRAARERGDYLIVGIHGDSTVNRVTGMNLPIMNLHERVLSVLGCRCPDDVLIDAPYEISVEMIESLRISEVIGTTTYDGFDVPPDARYCHAEKAGILRMMDPPNNFDMKRIFTRIRQNQSAYQVKFERKMAAEQHFYQKKHGADWHNRVTD